MISYRILFKLFPSTNKIILNFVRRNRNFISYKRSLLSCKVTFKSNLILFTSVEIFKILKKKIRKSLKISSNFWAIIWYSMIYRCKRVRIFIRIVSIHIHISLWKVFQGSILWKFNFFLCSFSSICIQKRNDIDIICPNCIIHII